MPTYDYVCDACGHQFEEFQSFSDEPLKKCPECKKKKLRRLFGTGAGIIFKGSGFYETDYRSDSYKSAAKKEAESAKPAAAESNGSGTASGGGDRSAAKDAGGAKDGGAAKSTGKSPKSST
jgi:putative FmdB family regulatory protein